MNHRAMPILPLGHPPQWTISCSDQRPDPRINRLEKTLEYDPEL